MWPEVADPVANVNDDAEHALFVERAVDAIRDGENPIDLWVPQVELGFPEFLLYQHGAHVLVAALDVALPGYIDPRRLFDLVRWILMVTFPLTVFWSLRRIGIGPVGAAVAGALAALLSGAHRYGFEYDSYVWRGLGLFTQLLGMHLVFIAFALLHDVLTRGRHMFAAAIACAALVLTHLIYAYMLAVTVIPLFLGTVTRVNLRANTLRLAAVGGIALVLSSYMWLPFLRESAFLNVSPYLGREKYDSFGAPTILGWLVSGDLFDHGRLPIFTVLVALGVLAALVTRRRTALLVLGLFALWLVLYFGRPTLGPVADLLPMSQGLLFHRFIGGVDLFAIILAGIGVDWLWRVLRVDASRLRFALGAAVLVLLLVPALGERWGYYADNTTWLQQTRDAIARDQDAAIVLGALAQQPPGRAYAGLRSNWGQSLSFGLPFNSVRLYNLLVAEGRDAVAPPYRGASLNADLLFDFNDQNLGEYALFDVEYVIAPPSVALPSALVPLVRTPTLILYRAPGGGYAEYASVSSRVAVATQTDLFPRMRGWLNSDAPGRRDFVRFDFPAKATPPDGWMATSRCPNDGVITYQRVEASRIDATAECLAASTLVFKLTYNPNWTVTVDGRSVATYMVSPSLLAVDLPAGRHAVSATYRSGPLKAPLLGLGALTLLAMAGVTLRQRRPAMAGLVVRARQAPWLAIARWRDVREALAARPRLAAGPASGRPAEPLLPPAARRDELAEPGSDLARFRSCRRWLI